MRIIGNTSSSQKRQHLPVFRHAALDRRAIDLLQPVEAEIFDAEAGHDGAVGHGLLERLGLEVALFGQVAHHAAGKAIAGPGGIDHLAGRKGGQDVGLMLAEEHRPVLALLDDHESRAELQHAAAGADQVLVARQQLGLAVVEHQPVDPLEHLQHVLAVVEDPVVHRVGHDQLRGGALIDDPQLDFRGPVGEEEELAAAIVLGQDGVELGHDVQVQAERLAVVHVRQIAAAPAEGLAAGDDLQAGRVDRALLQHLQMLRAANPRRSRPPGGPK